MDRQLLRGLAAAGLFHDVGKFAERTYTYSTSPEDQDIIKKKYRYDHGFYTEQVLQMLFPDCAQRELGNDEDGRCTICDLAARHHKPGTVLEEIVCQADRMAAGHEREATDEEGAAYPTEGRERKSQVPLISIFSRVGLPGQIDTEPCKDSRYRIGVPPLAREEPCERFFPCPPDDYASLSVREDYKTHWAAFVAAIRPEAAADKPLDILEHFDTLLEICRVFQWCLPETARRQDLSDVALFEHQKATAALASCLYCYHKEEATLKKSAVKDRKKPKFLLFCGDIGGIQRFVYQISSKGAYKMLKGRSFFVQLLAEILAREYLADSGLTPANILYCSGGKFYLLLPNLQSVRDRLEETTVVINQELFDLFKGDVYLRTAFEKMSGEDLTKQTGRTLSWIWDELAREVTIRDRHRYAVQAANDYDRYFGIDAQPKNKTCAVCHCAMGAKSGGTECATCAEMKLIGQKLKTAKYIVVSDDRAMIDEVPQVTIFGKHLWILDVRPVFGGRSGFIWALNDVTFPRLIKASQGTGRINAAPLIVGGNHTFEKDFEDIAQMAKGVPRLGVLRMDVDDLGRIFRVGLNNYRHASTNDQTRFHSMGRITTLSWQLAFFFGGLVPKFLTLNSDWEDKSTVVYAGGDDLFVLGAWDVVPDIALCIRDRFHRLCGGNPVFSISGGMVLTGGKFPIYKSAEMAGDAQRQAKMNQTVFSPTASSKRKEQVKNSFSFLETPMHWAEFAAVRAEKERLVALCEDRRNRPLLGRVQRIAASWYHSRERFERRRPKLSMAQIRTKLAAEQWRWRMAYSLARFCEAYRQEGIEKDIAAVRRFVLEPVAGTERPGIELLGVLGRWCELLLRSPDNQQGEK